ncbi:unnamed protein product [Merluccius merluccius]
MSGQQPRYPPDWHPGAAVVCYAKLTNHISVCHESDRSRRELMPLLQQPDEQPWSRDRYRMADIPQYRWTMLSGFFGFDDDR